MHGAGPIVSFKVPGGHAVHFPPLFPVNPALHMQLAMLLEPCCTENMFAGHIKHNVEPMSDLYVPAAHCVHAPPFMPIKPSLQLHAV